jgi:hypothetical protein
MSDREVITSFVAFLAANGWPGLGVDDWPEDHKDGEIDAVAGDLAIEHTSIDTLQHQRRDSDWLVRMIGNLEQEVPTPNCLLFVIIGESEIRRRKAWPALREALRHWLSGPGPAQLPDGMQQVPLATVPATIWMQKFSDQGVGTGLYFNRWSKGDPSLANRIRTLGDQKIRKLGPWRAQGKKTVLLLETDDIALMNPWKLASAFCDAYPQKPGGVDRIWHVDTRLTRSVVDLGTLVERYFAPGKAALLSVGEQIDTRSAAGRLVLNVLASVSQWEREAIGERTATAMQHKAAQGEYTGGPVPYGYRLADDGLHLEELPAEQAVIAETRRLRAAGLSLRAVARELDRQSLRSRVGRAFGAKQIAGMVG